MGFVLRKKPTVADHLVLAASARARAEMLLDQMQEHIVDLRQIITEAAQADDRSRPESR